MKIGWLLFIFGKSYYKRKRQRGGKLATWKKEIELREKRWSQDDRDAIVGTMADLSVISSAGSVRADGHGGAEMGGKTGLR